MYLWSRGLQSFLTVKVTLEGLGFAFLAPPTHSVSPSLLPGVPLGDFANYITDVT